MRTQISALLSLGAVAVATKAISAGAKASDHADHHTHSAHAHHAPATASNSWQLEAEPTRALVQGEPARLQIRLRDARGGAITSAELARVHEEKFHLLVVDETLTDYHHLHPLETSRGDFAVDFTPGAGGRYLVFADVADGATQTQRYLRAEVRAAGSRPTVDDTVAHVAVIDGYRFELSASHGINAANGGHLVVRVSDPDGNAVRNLEPIMGAFAHGVGFSSDLQAVLHVHPHGAEPRSKDQRAGPEISFHVSPDRAGFFRLYVQVRINGRDIFAPFGVQVDAKPTGAL